MKRILIPVDFSKTSENALFYALNLFANIEVEITILHTFRLPSTAFHLKSIDHILREDAEKDMESILENISKKYPQVQVKTKILEGEAEDSIIRFSKSGDFDLIAMGTKGVSGLKEVFIGSVAGEVISRSHVPVLVIPNSAKEFVTNDITLAISRYGISDQVTIQPLRELINITNSKLHILHLTEEEKNPIKPIINSLDNLHPHYIYTYCEQSIDQCINEYVTESNSQMLCLIRSKRDFFSRLITGSVTMKQTFHSKVPLLILHETME